MLLKHTTSSWYEHLLKVSSSGLYLTIPLVSYHPFQVLLQFSNIAFKLADDDETIKQPDKSVTP